MHVFGARFESSRWSKAPLPYGGFALRIATARNTEISERPPANDVVQNRSLYANRNTYSIYARISVTHKLDCIKHNPSNYN
jgi:hypothetical protein